jgi:mono/diheme cytochrome c family protein
VQSFGTVLSLVSLAACSGATPAPSSSDTTTGTREPSTALRELWSEPAEYAPEPVSAEAGEAYFGTYGVGDPYGAGIPLPIFRGLMRLYPDDLGRDFRDFNTRFGTVPNADAPDDPDAIPLGFHATRDPNTSTDFLVINCQICHAGRVRTSEGERIVTGLGNRELRIHAYAAAFAKIARDETLDERRLVRAASEEAARLHLRWPRDHRGPIAIAFLRALRARFEGRHEDVERLADGMPGRVATLEGFVVAMNYRYGTHLTLPEVTGWTRIPDVAPFRYRETNSFDGAATGAPVALVAEADFAFGVRPRWYDEHRHIATSMFLYLRRFDRDLPYPGDVSRELATRGYDAFERSCSSCHGHYARPGEPPRVSYTERIIPVDVVGTDPARAEAVTDEIVEAAARVRITEGLVRTERTGGYVPRPLIDVWAHGQYGHVGQWPDLTVLATPPEERPTRFVVDPRAPLDLERIGQRWRPADDRPLGEGEYLYDGTKPGFSVLGHPFLADLDAPVRRAILEYLKTL